VKAGWQTQKLGDLCDILDNQRKPITKRDRTAGEYPYYGATGIVDYINDYIFDEPLVLVGEDGAKWESGQNTAFKVEGKYWVNNHAHVLRPNRNIIIDSWLVFYLNHSDLRAYVSGLTVPKLNQAGLREIHIPLPPLPEQKRIVAILDEAFTSIDTAKKNTEKNLKNARELFESFLNLVFAQAWTTCDLVPLAEITTDITDGDHIPPPKTESGVPFITIGNINKETRKIDFTDTFMVPHDYIKSLKANRKPKKGDVLYTVTGSFGIPVLVDVDMEFCFQRHIGLVRPSPDIDSEWLYFLLLSPQVFKQAVEGATGTAQKTVALKILRKFIVPKVPLPDQRSAVEKLNTLSKETNRLESVYQRKLTALDELKQSLLHQAFSGQL